MATSGGLVALAICGIIIIIVSGANAFSPPSTTPTRPRGRCLASSAPSCNFEGGTETIQGDSSSSDKPPSPIGLSSTLPYIRIQKRGRHYDVQTAITTFQKSTYGGNNNNNVNDNINIPATTTTVQLHAQIHFGDASYFQYFNDDATFSSRYDNVLYELIVEDKFLTPSASSASALWPSGLKRLTPASPGSTVDPIAPTQADRSTASQYGLVCQVDGIQYCQENWVHADLTREEFLDCLEEGQRQQNTNKQGAQIPRQHRKPLWALASTSATYPGSEVVTALIRPLTTTSNSASAALTRRLFTHLFLPGDALSGWIRAALWLGVPSPELSIMLVDWSSLSYIGRRRGSKNDGSNNIAPISPIAVPVLLSLLTGNWGTARRLVFGQVLVGGQSSSDTSKQGVLIDKRNERAMAVLQETVSSLDQDSDNNRENNRERKKRIALLYGAGHCHDLHRRLQDEGMTPVRTEWRTAFRATAPKWGDFVNVDDWRDRSADIASNLPSAMDAEGIVKNMSVSTLESVAVGLVILPLYLLVGGLDWVSTVGDLGNALDGGMYLDGLAGVLLYLVRHVALYVGISKFVVDWGGNEGVFDEE